MRTCGLRCHEFCYDSTDQSWLYPENGGSGLICNVSTFTSLHDVTCQKTEINKTRFIQRVRREYYAIFKKIETASGFLRTQNCIIACNVTTCLCQMTIIRPSVQNLELNFVRNDAWWWSWDRNMLHIKFKYTFLSNNWQTPTYELFNIQNCISLKC